MIMFTVIINKKITFQSSGSDIQVVLNVLTLYWQIKRGAEVKIRLMTSASALRCCAYAPNVIHIN